MFSRHLPVNGQSCWLPAYFENLVTVSNVFSPQTSHSTFIAMVTVAFQLCGVSSKFTSTVNLILTSLLRMFSDFCMFVFGVVITFATVEYAENSKLI